MGSGISQEQRQQIDHLLESNSTFATLVSAMAQAAENCNLSSKSESALQNTSAVLPDVPATAAVVSIEQMKIALREADCLYDNPKIWEQLGAKEVPEVPEAVIQEAYHKGGRVIFQCSSISRKTDAIRAVGMKVYFTGSAKQSDFTFAVSEPRWVVVQSHVDRNKVGFSKAKVVTSDNPAPTPQDSFAVRAYARLDGGRQPRGCQNINEFTTESGTMVGSYDDGIHVHRFGEYDCFGYEHLAPARFGPARN